jgi:GAF domain-containing protein
VADENDIRSDVPELEEAAAGPVGGGHSLMADDLQTVGLRLSVAESLLRLLVCNLNFQEFCREVLVTLSQAIKCEAASILERNPADDTLFFRAAVGHSSEKIVKFVIPAGQGIAGYVVESRQPLLVSNVSENRHHLKAVSAAVGFETRNLIAFPLLIRGDVFGVVELINRAGDAGFSESDFELASQLGALVARSIEARLMINWAKGQAA